MAMTSVIINRKQTERNKISRPKIILTRAFSIVKILAREVTIWLKLYFNCYKYKYMKSENTLYLGSDKKPKWIDIYKDFMNGRRVRNIEAE